MISKKFGKVFFLSIEALGVFILFKIYSKMVWPYFLKLSKEVGNLLFWISLAAFGAIVALIVRKVQSNWTWKDIGFRVYRSWKKDIWMGIIVFCFFYLVDIPFILNILPKMSDHYVRQYASLNDMALFIAIIPFTIMIFVKGFITGALHEEIRFRGYLQGLFQKNSFPALGFLISLILFSFPHYFSHPEWSLVQVLNTVPGGIAFCLGYYATGSLIVPITAHTLANLVPSYAPFVYSRGYTGLSYVIVFVFGVLSLMIIFKGKEESKFFIKKMKEIFAKSGLGMILLGIVLGVTLLLMLKGLDLVQSSLQLSNLFYCLLLFILSMVCIAVSSEKWRMEK